MDLFNSYNEVRKLFKDKEMSAIKKHDKQKLIDSVLTLIDICDKMFESPSEIADACAIKTEELLKKYLATKLDPIEDKVPSNSERESHVLIIKNPEADDKVFSNETWSNAVQRNISKKLDKIPVKKVLLNHKGQGCIVLPDKDTCTNAKTLLEKDFEVNHENKKAKPLLPRLKIHNVGSENFESKEKFAEKILQKNTKIKNLCEQENSIAVTYYDANRKYAVLKVTPQVKKVLMKDPRIFVGMESFHVSEHYHVTQCFNCQGFGHVSGSEHCPRKDLTPLCLYCGGDHRSSVCTNKKTPSNQKCVNCSKSRIFNIKSGHKTHTANSYKCPLLSQEIENIKKITQNDSKNILTMESQNAAY